MRKILLACFLLCVPLSVFAKTVSNSEHESNCRMLMDMANTIMKNKQDGLPLIKVLEANDAAFQKNPDKNMYEIINKIARDAYSQPSYSTPSIKSDQLNEFSAKYYLGCMEMY